jgi:hypothetical protein
VVRILLREVVVLAAAVRRNQRQTRLEVLEYQDKVMLVVRE